MVLASLGKREGLQAVVKGKELSAEPWGGGVLDLSKEWLVFQKIPCLGALLSGLRLLQRYNL